MLGFPPSLSISSQFPNDNSPQLISPFSSWCRIALNPIRRSCDGKRTIIRGFAYGMIICNTSEYPLSSPLSSTAVVT